MYENLKFANKNDCLELAKKVLTEIEERDGSKTFSPIYDVNLSIELIVLITNAETPAQIISSPASA